MTEELNVRCTWCGTDPAEAAARHEGAHATWCVHFRSRQAARAAEPARGADGVRGSGRAAAVADLACAVCGAEMAFIACGDTCSGSNEHGESRAWNVYHCSACEVICREDVWDRPGRTWLFADNTTRFDPSGS